jgi:purine nucleosidase
MTPRSVILDTDIGTDVDDCLALALILGSPELKLLAVTTVYADVLLRARMVLKLLALAGRTDVPVAMGSQKPIMGQVPVYWAGHEGQGLLKPGDDRLQPVSEHAVDLIVRTVAAHPGEITLLAIGPLTNVALALLREPRLAQDLAGLMVMGGVVGGAGALHLPWVEHNFRCDPEAAAIVLASGVRLQIVPLDVTTKVCIRPADVANIRAAGGAYHAAVADQVDLYPHFASRGWTHLHDPLAAAGVIQPDLMQWESVAAVIETGGRHTAGQLLARAADRDTSTAQIALGVDTARAEQFITARIAA